MAAAFEWLADFSAFWGANFDQLDDVLVDMKRAEGKETDIE